LADISRYIDHKTRWDGPQSGPKAVPDRKIVVLAADLRNGGVAGVAEGVREAARVIGWQVTMIDGQGSLAGRKAAFAQGLSQHPDGLVIDGFDAMEQSEGVAAATAAHIAIVSWHAASGVGRVPNTPVFANITANTRDVAKAAAEWAFVDGRGQPGVVILTDGNFAVALAKSRRMSEIITAYGGTLLAVEDVAIAQAAERMPGLTLELWQRFGARWTHTLAINDIYYDYMGPALAAAGVTVAEAPAMVAAGDGASSAYQRIRARRYQAATVSEPLGLQGWQLVDELNRDFAGESWSGYEPPLKLVTAGNVAEDGGPRDHFDPDNAYRDHYRAIWGK
jgi:ribose transport system substrate-binding protein